LSRPINSELVHTLHDHSYYLQSQTDEQEGKGNEKCALSSIVSKLTRLDKGSYVGYGTLLAKAFRKMYKTLIVIPESVVSDKGSVTFIHLET
jgi:hypothetical protein